MFPDDTPSGFKFHCTLTLIKMGFPRTVIDWIMVCVTSCQFSINVNGELAGYFQGGRAETR